MKALILVLLFLAAYSSAKAQDMKYGFGFVFKNSWLEDGTLYVIKDAPAASKTVVGKIGKGQLVLLDSVTKRKLINQQPIYIWQEDSVKNKSYAQISIAYKLKGVITKRSRGRTSKTGMTGDTLFLKFWDINSSTDSFKGSSSVVNSKNNGDSFAFVINPNYWTTQGRRSFRIPYRAWQFSATSLPFRVLTFRNAGSLESDFLNANVTFVKVYGNSLIYQSEYIDARNTSFSAGPYAGLSSLSNTVTGRKEFGLNYGVNIIYAVQSFNLTAAVGWQNGFREDTKQLQPYLGFGIGFKLVEFFSPEIKNKE